MGFLSVDQSERALSNFWNLSGDIPTRVALEALALSHPVIV